MSDHWNDKPQAELDATTGDTARMLNLLAEGIRPNPAFAADLERRLVEARASPRRGSALLVRRVAPALLWIVAIAAMALVVDWAIRSLAPEPVPAARSTKTPTLPAPVLPVLRVTATPSGAGYDWHGTTLYLNAPLPQSPAEADVYLADSTKPITLEEITALGERFGIRSMTYLVPGEVRNTQDYLLTDGKQSLRVRSSAYFTYTADIVKAYNYFGGASSVDGENAVRAFLEAHGFTFPYRVEWSDFRNAYLVEPLSQDGTPLRYEHHSPPMLLVTLDGQGQVLSLQASLLTVQPVGRYGILSAEEAFQELLDPTRVNGFLEAANTLPGPIHQWNRTYPTDQTLTIYGRVSSAPAVEPGTPPFIQIDAFPVTGQTSGLEAVSGPTYVQATGQFVSDNGVEKFNIEAWKISDVNEAGLVGTIQREDGQAVLTADDGARYTLPDVPEDVPMPFEKAFVVGTQAGDTFEWKLIDDRVASGGGGGGGGGGGSGFYKLNLTGTPVPFPPATATPVASEGVGGAQYVVQAGDTLGGIAAAHGTSIDTIMQLNGIKDANTLMAGQTLILPASEAKRIEGLRGIVTITIQVQDDGSQLASYGFFADLGHEPGGYMLLQGENLQDLQAYNSRPVDIWGTLQDTANGIQTVKVDRFEIPFPDLKVQVLRGKQKITQIDGQPATLFTTDDGVTYVQLLSGGTTDESLIGVEGDEVLLETVAIPGESLGGYPGLRVFSAALAINPKTGSAFELPIRADKPEVLPASPGMGNLEVRTATIEKVELVHFLSDPRYAVRLPDAQPPYFQPVWRFYGHYSDGDEFEILVQALRQEFLLPEVEPALLPG